MKISLDGKEFTHSSRKFITKEQKQAKYKTVSALSKVGIKIRIHTLL